MSKTDIFHFNHIDKTINDDKLLEIKTLYKYYHKLYWGHKKAFKYFKRINLISNITSTCLVAVGTIVSSVTMNPIVKFWVLFQALAYYSKHLVKSRIIKENRNVLICLHNIRKSIS